jgi:hypothetical protein
MLHRTKRAVVILVFGCLALGVCAPAALGQAVVTDMQLTDQTIVNECNGELVVLNGTLHQETTFNTTPSGNTHTSLNATIRLNGYGQVSGAYYVAKENVHNETNTKGFGQEQFFATKIKLVSQGPAPDMVDRATLHVVIDKTGTNVKVDISKHQITCK